MFTLATFIYSCNTERSEPSPVSATGTSNNQNGGRFVNPYEHVGIKHNEGLDYVYGQLQGQLLDVDEVTALQLTDQAVKNYLAIQQYSQSELTLAQQLVDVNYTPIDAGYTAETMSKFTEQQINFLDQLTAIVLDEELSISQVHYDIVSLEIAASEQLSESDQVAVFCATATARHSTQYWYDDTKWLDLNEPFPLVNKVNWGEVGVSDLAGAAQGAVSGAVGGGIAGGAGGALAGGVAGGLAGGLGASAGNLVKQLFAPGKKKGE